jgi:Protein of unknown function (DUF3606)
MRFLHTARQFENALVDEPSRFKPALRNGVPPRVNSVGEACRLPFRKLVVTYADALIASVMIRRKCRGFEVDPDEAAGMCGTDTFRRRSELGWMHRANAAPDRRFNTAWRMSRMDNRDKRGQPDRSRINLSEDYEVKYWTKHLGVSREQLAKAVEKVGNSAAAVRKELGLLGAPH